MQIHCQSCGKQIPAEHINIEKAIAKCSTCSAVFGFTDQIEGLSETGVKSQYDDLPMPHGVRIDTWDGSLTITRRWLSPAYLFLAFFCVIWNGFLVFWYTVAFAGNAPLIMKLFPLGHAAVGAGLVYFTLAGFLNRTRIRVSDEALTVRHGPLPWFGSRDIPTDDIQQLYCTEHYHRSRHGTGSTTYRLNAALQDGRKIALLSGLSDTPHALFIEQEIESHLGIKDRRVRGEMNS